MSQNQEVYILGGYQTDFARNWTKERKHLSALMREGVRALSRPPSRAAGSPDGSRRQLRRRALLASRATSAPSSSRSIPPSAVCRPPPRGRLRLRAHRDPRRVGRDRSRPLRPRCVVGIEQMKTVDRPPAATSSAPRHGTSTRPRASSFPSRSSSAARRRVRQALRPQGRAPRAASPRSTMRMHAATRWRRRATGPDESHAQHGDKFNAGHRRTHQGQRLLAGDRRLGGVFLASEKFATEYAKRNGIKLESTSRASSAGATTRRRSSSTTRSPRARTPYVLPHYAPDDRRRVRAAPDNRRRRTASTGSRPTTASRPPNTWRSTTSGSRSRARLEGGRGGLDRDSAASFPINPSGGLIGARPSGRRDRRAADARLLHGR